MNAKQLRVALDFYPDNAEILINAMLHDFKAANVLVPLDPALTYDEKNGYLYIDAADQSAFCACGGSLAVPDPHVEGGLGPCPDCVQVYPHKVEAESCVYCGMFAPDGPCPSLEHPARKPQVQS